MTIVVEPELGVPLETSKPSPDLKDRVEPAANTAKELGEHGLDVEPTKEDKDIAAKISVAYADNPEKTSKKVTEKRISTLTPASLILTDSILETDNADPRVRIRALELLGKISDVGLFAEKSEVTITHQSTDDLREKLRSKLAKLVNPPEKIENAVIMDGEAIDVDKELGLDEENDK
jgi:hypothetical protein